jgi:TPR repeat protein
MQYPLISEYIDAIRSAEDNFDKLSYLRPVLDDNGNPIMSSGNFAVVFKMTDGEKNYAVKCFTREQEGREDAYKKISNCPQVKSCNFMVKVKYYSDELYVDNNQSKTSEFPVLVMDWIEGVGLEEYISINSNNPEKLGLLSSNFNKLIDRLLPEHFAHGDLKPDNIIIDKDDNIKLIDYDGMFVPSMEGEISTELGTPKFQFYQRRPEDFNEYIDDYGALYLAVILRLLTISNKTFDSLLSLEIPDLIAVVSNHIDDRVVSKLLSAFLLACTRGFVEREVLSICLYDESKYSREKEALYISRARKGDTTAMLLLGNTYSRGIFTPRNQSKAVDWYYLARAMGNVNGACGICRHYYYFERNFNNSIDDDIIQRTLLSLHNDFSLCREGEKNLFKDTEYAITFFNKAAELNFAPAINWLSRQKGPEEGRKMLEKSANLGDGLSLEKLGDYYSKGEYGFPKDPKISLSYYRRAAEVGNAKGQYITGLAYLNGWQECEQNIPDAIKWLKLASDNEYQDATIKLAKIYLLGKLVKKDIEYSIELLYHLVNRDIPNEEALFLLAVCHQYGIGFPADYHRAILYYDKAIHFAWNGYTLAEIELDRALRRTGMKDETSVKAIEIIDAWEEDTGKYSDDGKRFLCYFWTYGEEYQIKNDTEVLCDYSFNDLYSEVKDHYLEKLTIPESLIHIGNNVFCASIKHIECKSQNFVVENGMLLSQDKKILYRYFGENYIVEIPSGIKYIKGGAFTGLEIFRIIIPESVEYIGDNPFAGTGYTDSNNQFIHAEVVSNSPFIIVKESSIYSKKENSLVACWSRTNSVNIKSSCLIIGENAFWDASIKNIYLPSSITAIRESSFRGYNMNLNNIFVEHGDKERIESILPRGLRAYISELPDVDKLPF